MDARVAAPGSSLTPTTGVNFDQGFDPITPGGLGMAGAALAYTVHDGDTLRTIARTLFGDEGLWYVIAQANGLSGAEPLAAGRVLLIPNKVINVRNKASTFRVYDPNTALGDLSSSLVNQSNATSLQPAPPKKKGCGGVGQILMIIVAVAVAAVVGPWAATALGGGTGAAGLGGAAANFAGFAVGGATASVASQGVGLLTGVQDKFSWKDVAVSALRAGVGGVVSGGAALPPGQAAVQAIKANVISQGISVATGLQKRFDWAGVAMAGITAGTGARVGILLGTSGVTGLPNLILSGAASAVAGSATLSLINGTDFGDNLRAVLPEVIGSTIGNAIAMRVMSGPSSSTSANGKGDMRSKSGSDGKNVDLGQLTPVDVSGPIQPVYAAPNPAILNPGPLSVLGNVALDGTYRGVTVVSGARTGVIVDGSGAITLSSSAFLGRTGDGRMYIPSFNPDTGEATADSSIIFKRGTDLSVRYNDPSIGLNNLQVFNRTSRVVQTYKVEQGRTYSGDGYRITFGGEAAPEYNAALAAAQKDSARTLGYLTAGVVTGGATAGLGGFYLGGSLAAEALTGGLSLANSNFFFNKAAGRSNSVSSYATDVALGAAFAPAARAIGVVGSWGLSKLTAGSTGTVTRTTLDAVAEPPSLRETILANLQRSAAARPSANFAKYTQLESGIVAADSGPLDTKVVLQGVTDRAVAELAANPGLARRFMSPGSYNHLVEGTGLAPASYGKAVERLSADIIRNDSALSSILQYQSRPFRSTPDFLGIEGYNLRPLDITTVRSTAAHSARSYGSYTEIVTHPGLPSNLVFPR